jgi:hypothetical protein
MLLSDARESRRRETRRGIEVEHRALQNVIF